MKNKIKELGKNDIFLAILFFILVTLLIIGITLIEMTTLEKYPSHKIKCYDSKDHVIENMTCKTSEDYYGIISRILKWDGDKSE